MRAWRGAAALALVFLAATAASGEEAPETRHQVALDVTPADSPIVPLLRAELRALAVDVVEGEAATTIQVDLTSESLEVRIIDHATGHAAVRETFSAAGTGAMDPRTAVLHTVELLRWHLRFAPAGDTPKATPSVEAKPAQPASPSQTSNVRIGLTPVAAYSPGGTGLGLGGQIDVLERWGRFGARVLGGSVLVGNRLSVPEGSLDVTSSWGGLAGVLILGGDRPTSLEVGAGAAVFVSALHGKANADNLGQDDRLVTFAPFGDFRLRRRITAGFGLSLGSSVFVPLRSSALRVVGREVGRYGQVVVAFGVGAELALF